MWYFTAGEDDPDRDPITEPRLHNYRITLVPGFADLDGFEGQSALTLLKEFLRSVADSLREARRAFFPNTERVVILTAGD